MTRRTIATVGAWAWLAACAGGSPPPPASSPAPADLVVRNARVYTVDASRSWAEALAVRGDRLVAVGSARDVQPYVGPSTRVVDAGGRLVLPGFHDSHVHPIMRRDGGAAVRPQRPRHARRGAYGREGVRGRRPGAAAGSSAAAGT